MIRKLIAVTLTCAIAGPLVPGKVFIPADCEAQVSTGTCCPEVGSECIVGTLIRANRYYKQSGTCG